jgi:hypothetical protein
MGLRSKRLFSTFDHLISTFTKLFSTYEDLFSTSALLFSTSLFQATEPPPHKKTTAQPPIPEPSCSLYPKTNTLVSQTSRHNQPNHDRHRKQAESDRDVAFFHFLREIRLRRQYVFDDPIGNDLCSDTDQSPYEGIEQINAVRPDGVDDDGQPDCFAPQFQRDGHIAFADECGF